MSDPSSFSDIEPCFQLFDWNGGHDISVEHNLSIFCRWLSGHVTCGVNSTKNEVRWLKIEWNILIQSSVLVFMFYTLFCKMKAIPLNGIWLRFRCLQLYLVDIMQGVILSNSSFLLSVWKISLKSWLISRCKRKLW